MDSKLKTGRKKKADRVPAKFEPGFIAALDGRTGIAQEMRERFQELTCDLGGADSLSYQQRSLCERVLWLEHWIRVQEAALARGDNAAFDVGRYTQAANSIQGLYAKLGLHRVARDVPTLGEYLKAKQGSPQQ
ncbi:hypothetical protein [Sedimenticola hydrogenitrophicus]|uniref:hypothetical protein n=1 Tax=Sedimenticola hydrogenitrophicus TaxID=2967975 RepID=UPI0023B135D7|nr:hypothetical protein [Sedimenticola hydrogenitrophicus]